MNFYVKGTLNVNLLTLAILRIDRSLLAEVLDEKAKGRSHKLRWDSASINKKYNVKIKYYTCI